MTGTGLVLACEGSRTMQDVKKHIAVKRLVLNFMVAFLYTADNATFHRL
jgi:hypothetical protein